MPFAFAVRRGACEGAGMNPAMLPVLFIAFIVGVVGFTFWGAAQQGKRATENVRQMAATLGLQFVEKPPTLGMFYTDARAAGQMRGKRVEVFPFATGSGKSRIQWSAVSAAVPVSTALTFHLRRQGFSTKFLELFGAKEIQVGDAEFDRAWFIQTNQPDYFGGALLPELRAKINSLVRELGTQARGMEFKLEQNGVRYAEIGSFSNGDCCKRCLRAADIVCDLADVAEVFAEQQKAN
jgi:hypothetical protein